MKKTKIIAFYLPQFHRIPENDKFWGEGFTDWVTVRKAKPLFKGHKQPRVPENGNYYDLSCEENVVWQAKLAKEHGIDGFGVYHYWFNNDTNILTRPAEIIRDNKDIDIDYFLAWDNANWKRSWSNVSGNAWTPLQDKAIADRKGPEILIPYILGDQKDWEIHYKELYKHFVSPKYIKVENKPVFAILQFDADIERMCRYWDELAKRDGFGGMYFIFKYSSGRTFPEFSKQFIYEPVYHFWNDRTLLSRISNKMKSILMYNGTRVVDYSNIWKKIVCNPLIHKESILPGAFVGYDDTPRRAKKGILTIGSSPEKFHKYLSELYRICNKENKEFLFITAWNEWGEGAVLEPDNECKLDYLKVLRTVKNQ